MGNSTGAVGGPRLLYDTAKKRVFGKMGIAPNNVEQDLIKFPSRMR